MLMVGNVLELLSSGRCSDAVRSVGSAMGGGGQAGDGLLGFVNDADERAGE